MAPVNEVVSRVRSATASLGIGATSEEAEPAHAAVHADGAFNSLPPQTPGGIVLWLALEGISAAQVAALNAQKAEGRGQH